jgi:hypothetical protein
MRGILLAALALCGCSGAQAFGRIADLQVIDRSTGETLQVYEHRGRHYIVGAPGHEYRLFLASRDGGRLLAVGSVDGVNIVSGDTAAPGQGGYVVGPWQTLSVDGWRTSLDSTSAFYFTTLADSYAARTGRPDNVGVIGVALFREAQHCCADQLFRDEDARRDAPAAAAPEAAQSGAARAENRAEAKDKVGTGYGRSEYSSASYTSFERASATPDETIALYYDSYENLCRQGVIRAPRPRPFPAPPNPFPGFVPPP